MASYAGGSETTIYVAGMLEKVTATGGTVYRHYLGAGSANVVYSRSTTGAEFTKYITADHLNSSTVVMDSAGAALVNLSFASFGARRGSAWSGAPSSGDYTQISNVTRHGYTGHEQLDNINLVHMNGRVFDPVLGRFLSADQVIRDVRSSQSWSGYSYVEGRNLSWTDPSGWAAAVGMTLRLPILKNEPTALEAVEVINSSIGEFDFERYIGFETAVFIGTFRQFSIAGESQTTLETIGVTGRRVRRTTGPTPAASSPSDPGNEPAGTDDTRCGRPLAEGSTVRQDDPFSEIADPPIEQVCPECYLIGVGRLVYAGLARLIPSVAAGAEQSAMAQAAYANAASNI